MELNLRTLSRLEPICGLSSARLEELVRLCAPETHARGSDPLRDIGVGAHLVFLLAGELKIVLLDGSIRVLVGGCDIANWPIGYKTVLPLSSKAITDVTLLRIDFELLDIMMTWDDLSAAVDPAPAPEWGKMTGAFSAQALTAGALAQLPPAHIHELLQRFERIVVHRGASVIKEGEPGDYYYLIESGRCEVFKRVGGADVRLAEFKAGDAFGEEALVSDSLRNASVVMKTDGVLFRLAKPDFLALLRTPLLHALGRAAADARIAAGACWLDVRYAAEFAENGLPGAVNLPLSEIRSAFGLLDQSREYIVYCRSGRRSSAAAFLLAQRGFKAFWLQDGLLGSGA
ncbi:cyclic nucleotide-binding domain-containing protein [Dechloromonas sp. TW-R-39-2]|uniref:cyclic nucleotide-binding domain-containing protein n=1 Tax=Dechloromonas sp. TW-R-39-2 TaxID=2654218 RepID=UPI00193D4CEB|nr:cyclic nucleotide-binding domain-containing protein [Dechloromonas sp. TW-R-39-2]QRM20556.1 cyclic nucleotide-binding domain-containing protein [Dechloromonas sp. TW-R-39-2]